MIHAHRKRFLAKNVLAGACGCQHGFVMQRIGCCNVDGVNVGIADQSGKVVVRARDTEFFGESACFLRRAAEAGDEPGIRAFDNARRDKIGGDPAQADHAPAQWRLFTAHSIAP